VYVAVEVDLNTDMSVQPVQPIGN